jgi:hypothetical protein
MFAVTAAPDTSTITFDASIISVFALIISALGATTTGVLNDVQISAGVLGPCGLIPRSGTRRISVPRPRRPSKIFSVALSLVLGPRVTETGSAITGAGAGAGAGAEALWRDAPYAKRLNRVFI